MPFGINISAMKAQALLDLPDAVTRSLVTAQPSEQEGVQLIGQILYWKLSKIDDASLVDINTNGNIDAMTGEETFVVSIRVRPIRGGLPGAATPAAPKKWDPSVGPISITPAPASEPVAEATPVATVPAVPTAGRGNSEKV